MRPEWVYGDHPPACNCWRCVALRASGNADRQGRRRILPTKRGRSSGCLWMAAIVVAVCIAVLATIFVMRSTFFESLDLQPNTRQDPTTFAPTAPAPLKTPIQREVIEQSSTPSPTVEPTMSKLVKIEPKVRPTPTVTVNEIFRLNSIGELSDEEAAEILENRKSDDSNIVPTPQLNTQPEVTPTIKPITPIEPTPLPASNSAVDYRPYLLELINQDRKEHGLSEVELGKNTAAQIHADELFEYEFTGHWGLDGLKPYMRYTLAGGTGKQGENVSGLSTPRIPGVSYSKTPIKESLMEAQEGFMQSSGHRAQILNPQHQEVNLGITCDDVYCSVVQQFESNFVEFVNPPTIENGLLRFAGATLGSTIYFNTDVYYDPLPVPLSTKQIRTTYCSDAGTPILFIREPAPPGSYYSTDITDFSWPDCRDPRDTDGSEKPIGTALPNQNGLVPFEDASIYVTQGNQFDIAADISDYISQYGDGVYTIIIWGKSNAGFSPLTNYSVFVESP
jgi:uncharacterized protein YkwD